MHPHSPFRILRNLTILLAVILVIIFGGSLAFWGLGSTPTWLDALYSVIMVMTGIGADTPRTTAGKLFNCILALVSVGLLVSLLGQIFHYVSARSLREVFLGLHDRKVRAMNNHIIICGTSYTLHELLLKMPEEDRGRLWIIVRTDEEAKRLEHHGIHVHVEDFTQETPLRRAGIDTAACVIACGENDAENAFVCLSAKHLRKDVPVIVRLTRSENREKLRAAGADEIINPAELAAAQMRAAMSAFTPEQRG